MIEHYTYKDDETLQTLINASTVIQERQEQVTVESLARQLILNYANPMPDYRTGMTEEVARWFYCKNCKQALCDLCSECYCVEICENAIEEYEDIHE